MSPIRQHLHIAESRFRTGSPILAMSEEFGSGREINGRPARDGPVENLRRLSWCTRITVPRCRLTVSRQARLDTDPKRVRTAVRMLRDEV